MDKLILKGKLDWSRSDRKFNQLIKDNKEVFYKYFGVDLFQGSLNVRIDEPKDLQQNLDKGIPAPTFVIPKSELAGMPDYIGNGQAWLCSLSCHKFPEQIKCWVFRRISSRVPKGIIEIVTGQELVKPYGLTSNDSVIIELHYEEREF